MAPPEKRTLTSEERTLVLSVPGVVERAAWEVARRYGPILPQAELVSLGHMAVVLAAQRYDPAYGVAFGTWAFYRAVDAMLDGARRERKSRALVAAARAAACRFAARERPPQERDMFSESDAELEARLTSFSDGVLAAMVVGALKGSDDLTAEEDLIERDAWARTVGALRSVLAELRPEQRELIDLCYLDGEPLKRAAELQGVNYFSLLDRHQALLKLLGARLRGLGVDGSISAPDGEFRPALDRARAEAKDE